MTSPTGRRLVRANISLTLDGRYHGPGGPADIGAIVPYMSADPRDRGYARWLVGTDKVVFSTTVTKAPWERTRMVDGPVADVVVELSGTGEGDILANTSPSIVKPLLAADLVDRLYLMVVPEVAGDGQRLFDDGMPGSRWTLSHHEAGDLGELALVYDRAR